MTLKLIKIVPLAVLLLIGVGPFPGAEAEDGPLVIQGVQHWQGEVALIRPVQVPQGSTLVIEAGTRIEVRDAGATISVAGELRAEGHKDQPIEILGTADWQGIELNPSPQSSQLVWVHISGAKTALSSSQRHFKVLHSRFINCDTAIRLHRNSTPYLEDNQFSANRVAIDIEMRSQVEIRKNRFTNNQTAVLASHSCSGVLQGNQFAGNAVAVHIQHQFLGQISGNRFQRNEKAIVCDQTLDSPQITQNRFESNQQGVVSLLASKPLISRNHFEDNNSALVNSQLGSPVVEQNLFLGNEIAISNERRAAPKILRNQFSHNRLVLFCDYLSYPLVRQNNFEENRLAVRLGEHQSYAWEEQGGSRQQAEKVLKQSGRQGKMANFEAPLGDTIDVRENWWGDLASAELFRPTDNMFYDRRQSPWVVDDLNGQRYLRDQVAYRPWLENPVRDAGL